MRLPIIALACIAIAGIANAAPPEGVSPVKPGIPPVIAVKASNLVPIASRMTKGTISVRNTGTIAAGPFKVTVECKNLGKGSCVDPPEDAVAPYEDAAFPNKLTVTVPGLAPGHVFNHKISFWDGLVWPSGNYEFTVVADAGGAVAETNEGDNSGGTVMGVP
ncbi:MAG: CARDB domain-containing protein [Alphaproteobacteria bacterium]|jgi:hypothetical protein|nr:CARDB domain-containing protein [Alphaproteobacteria bacterium]